MMTASMSRDLGVVRSGAEAGLLCLLNLGGENPHDVGAARIELGDLSCLDVEPCYSKRSPLNSSASGSPT